MTTPIPAEGRVELRLVWDGQQIREAAVRSQRPQPGLLLLGQAPERARVVIPRLFSLCGDAQTVATEALLSLLGTGSVTDRRGLEWAARIRLENIREHLWRLGLDWPRVTGLEPQPLPLRGLLSGRSKFLEDSGAVRTWALDTGRSLFGAPLVTWLETNDPEDFQRWLERGSTPLAALLGMLQPKLKGLGGSRVPLFNAAKLEAFSHELLPRLRDDPDFHWRPDWLGRSFEMGPLARNRERGLIAALLADQGWADSWVRVVARVLELARELQSLTQNAPPELSLAGHREGDEAVVALEMARGTLLHWIKVSAGVIHDYRIVAPTEWNFHPQGPALEGLSRLRGDDERQLRDGVTHVVMALDPCVQYGLEIVHA